MSSPKKWNHKNITTLKKTGSNTTHFNGPIRKYFASSYKYQYRFFPWGTDVLSHTWIYARTHKHTGTYEESRWWERRSPFYENCLPQQFFWERGCRRRGDGYSSSSSVLLLQKLQGHILSVAARLTSLRWNIDLACSEWLAGRAIPFHFSCTFPPHTLHALASSLSIYYL